MLRYLLIIASLMLVGCGGESGSNAKPDEAPKKVTYTVVNKTGAKIIAVGINSSDSKLTPMSYGSIAKGASETLKNDYLPTTIGLHWSKMNKDRTSKTVKIAKSLGADYRGPVKLTITVNGKVLVSK